MHTMTSPAPETTASTSVDATPVATLDTPTRSGRPTQVTDPVSADEPTVTPEPAAVPEPAAAPEAGDADRAAKARETRAEWLSVARTFVVDIFGPIALHSWLTRQGWSDVHALMAAGSLPLAGIVADRLRGTRIGGLSILVLGGIVLSIALGLLTNDARFVLLEGALSSAAAGVFAIVTLFTSRTLVELFATGAASEDTEKGAKLAAAFQRPDVRGLARAVTGVFAAVFFVSAAAQAALAMWAPVGIAFAYNRFGFIPCLVVIVVASSVLTRRAWARGELRGLVPQPAAE